MFVIMWVIKGKDSKWVLKSIVPLIFSEMGAKNLVNWLNQEVYVDLTYIKIYI